jgi:hypothetical protein
MPGFGQSSSFRFFSSFTGSAESVQTFFPDPGNGEIFITIDYPFRFSGLLVGVLNGIDYRYELEGRGRGRINGLRFVESLRGRALNSSYTFEAAAPVPEPGTVLMVAMGLAGVAVRARRRIVGRPPTADLTHSRTR